MGLGIVGGAHHLSYTSSHAGSNASGWVASGGAGAAAESAMQPPFPMSIHSPGLPYDNSQCPGGCAAVCGGSGAGHPTIATAAHGSGALPPPAVLGIALLHPNLSGVQGPAMTRCALYLLVCVVLLVCGVSITLPLPTQ